jgi:hypothetical protein
MSYTLKIGDKEVGKVDSIKTPQLKEVAKQTKGFDFDTLKNKADYICKSNEGDIGEIKLTIGKIYECRFRNGFETDFYQFLDDKNSYCLLKSSTFFQNFELLKTK